MITKKISLHSTRWRRCSSTVAAVKYVARDRRPALVKACEINFRHRAFIMSENSRSFKQRRRRGGVVARVANVCSWKAALRRADIGAGQKNVGVLGVTGRAGDEGEGWPIGGRRGKQHKWRSVIYGEKYKNQ